jgi:hypothetical protein
MKGFRFFHDNVKHYRENCLFYDDFNDDGAVLRKLHAVAYYFFYILLVAGVGLG